MTARLRILGFVATVGVAFAVFGAFAPVPQVPGMPPATSADPPPDRVHGPAVSTLQDRLEDGYPIENRVIVVRCQRCHEQDETGRMTRISYERKTPEGWQTSIRRMMALNDVQLSQDEAREIVRYLSNRQGLAPEELEPGRFEVERRLIVHDYEGNDDVEFTCIQCHSMGRVITQRRTREEWELLMSTHRGLYPLVDFQAFRSFDLEADGAHPMDEAVDYLSGAYPLETPEWSAWSASMRTPRLVGTWALSGFEPGKGQLFGTVEVTQGESPDEFLTSTTYVYAESGESVQRSGQSIVYTGHQWRGRSNPGTESELREVMSVERGWQRMTGRWFTGAYDEFGPDVTLTRVSNGAAVTGVHPPALLTGTSTEVHVFGAGLPADAGAFDFGPGVSVAQASGGGSSATLQVTVEDGAAIGARDLFVNGLSLADGVRVHDGVDWIEVTPFAGMARVGGGAFPKGYQSFDAIGWDAGPDGERDTDDDLRLGRVDVAWSMEEYTATFDDDDLAFVGSLDANGVFTPAIDGPNTERSGMRNNVGDVWVVATYSGPGASADDPHRARANLIVTVPLYMRFDPWQVTDQRLVP